MRRLAVTVLLVSALAAAFLVRAAGADDSHSYEVELDNAFGIVDGSEVRIAGVNSGTVEKLEVNEAKRAVVTIEVSGPLSQFHSDATCSSEPQSLIAEYFLDCQPGRSAELLDEGGLIPVSQTTITVQTDLVFNTLREPFRDRLALIINEFGTGLAGNPDSLNAAIRRGVPALRELRRTFAIVASERRTIRDLTTDAERIIGRLAERRDDVTGFVRSARATAELTAERREDLARDLHLLPGFLDELGPTMDRLAFAASVQEPVLRDVGASAGRLEELTEALPAFAAAAVPALDALGAASVSGREALLHAADEVRILRRSTPPLPELASDLAQFLSDLDNPRLATEINAEAAFPQTNRRAPTGYTGFESLANVAYYLTNSSSQFDQVGHLTQFNLYDLLTQPCSLYNAGPTFPSKQSTGFPPLGTYVPTRNVSQAHWCTAFLGPRQPGINFPTGLGPYDPSVCPDGSTAPRLCNPNGRRVRAQLSTGGAAVAQGGGPPSDGGSAAPPSGAGSGRGPDPTPDQPGAPGLLPELPAPAGDLLDLLGVRGEGGLLGGAGSLLGPGGRGGQRDQGPSRDLLDFLFSS